MSEVIHIVDDDEAMRDALQFLLRSHRFTVRIYESARRFLGLVPNVEPGCLVTDVRMPDMDGVELLRRLNSLRFDMPVVVMTAHGDVQLAVEAMKIGAVDFLEKPFDDDRLLAAIRRALEMRGRGVRDDDPAERASIEAKLAELSQREMQVLQGLILGYPNKTIAYDLAISPRTVEIYRANVMTKMGATSLAQLIRMATIGNVKTVPLKSG